MPTNLKVLIGEDTEGIDARLVARDSELDLAWVKIKEPGTRKFAYVDMAGSKEGAVGERMIGIRRMGKYFDRQAVVCESLIGGVTKKPRRLYVPMQILASDLGLPLFAEDGKVLGVRVVQMPTDADADEGAGGMSTQASTVQEVRAGLILPAADVVEATRRAQLAAASQPAEEDDEAAASQPQSQPAATSAPASDHGE